VRGSADPKSLDFPKAANDRELVRGGDTKPFPKDGQ